MKHAEWEELELVLDPDNPFCPKYIYPNGDSFYVEPVFYTKLTAMVQHHPKEKKRILDSIEAIVKKNHNVILTGNYDAPQTEADGYIILELEDITDPLQIYVEDKSRGSDYGD